MHFGSSANDAHGEFCPESSGSSQGKEGVPKKLSDSRRRVFIRTVLRFSCKSSGLHLARSRERKYCFLVFPSKGQGTSEIRRFGDSEIPRFRDSEIRRLGPSGRTLWEDPLGGPARRTLWEDPLAGPSALGGSSGRTLYWDDPLLGGPSAGWTLC